MGLLLLVYFYLYLNLEPIQYIGLIKKIKFLRFCFLVNTNPVDNVLLHSCLQVFEYFASFLSSEGELLMRPEDLMRAVVPVFPPSESNLVRDGYLIGERSPGELRCERSEFFMLFDVNNDGHISFKE